MPVAASRRWSRRCPGQGCRSGSGCSPINRRLVLPLRGLPAQPSRAAVVVVCAAAQPAAAPVQNVPSHPARRVVRPHFRHFEIFHDGCQRPGSEAIRDPEAPYRQLSAALKHECRGGWSHSRAARGIERQSRGPVARRAKWRAGGKSPRDFVRVARPTDRHRRARTHTPVRVRHRSRHQPRHAGPDRRTCRAPARRMGTGDLRTTRAAVAAGAIPSVADLATTDRHWAHAVFDFVAAQRGEEGVRRCCLHCEHTRR